MCKLGFTSFLVQSTHHLVRNTRIIIQSDSGRICGRRRLQAAAFRFFFFFTKRMTDTLLSIHIPSVWFFLWRHACIRWMYIPTLVSWVGLVWVWVRLIEKIYKIVLLKLTGTLRGCYLYIWALWYLVSPSHWTRFTIIIQLLVPWLRRAGVGSFKTFW